MGETPPIRAAFGHRWRYSQVARPLGRDHLSSDDGTLLVGGDWTLGRTLDDAARSGDAMASAVLG
jgi:predicted NAD/FAD-dependent oxidoreductase